MAERYRARGQSTIYDPYRYSYTIDEKKVIKDNQLTLIPKKEYEKIKDFHPFANKAWKCLCSSLFLSRQKTKSDY